jgi:hypothetical protein
VRAGELTNADSDTVRVDSGVVLGRVIGRKRGSGRKTWTLHTSPSLLVIEHSWARRVTTIYAPVCRLRHPEGVERPRHERACRWPTKAAAAGLEGLSVSMFQSTLGVSGNTMLARRELDNGSTYPWRHHPAVVVILSGDAGLSGSDLWLCLAMGGPVWWNLVRNWPEGFYSWRRMRKEGRKRVIRETSC